MKSEYRRIAYNARMAGEQVYFNHESIRIGEQLFFENDIPMLSEKYRGDDGAQHDARSRVPFQPRVQHGDREEWQNDKARPPFQNRPQPLAQNQENQQEERARPPFQFRQYQPTHTDRDIPGKGRHDGDKDEAGLQNADHQPKDREIPTAKAPQAATNLDARKTVPIYTLYPPIDPLVKIKLTESGLCFSGYTAFLSNHYERPFVFEDIEHRTVDHGYCFKKAVCYERPDLADKVRNTVGPIEAKDHVRNLGPNPNWDRIKVPTLKALFIAKLEQHPDLLDALLKTAPHRLIEASWDSLWGGGSPFRFS